MRELLDGADLPSNCLIDLAVVNHVLAVFRRRPGEHEHVMSFASLDLGERAVANLLYRNDVNCDLGIVLLAPVPGHHVHKPLIKFGEKMAPFRDVQCLLAGGNATGKKEKGTESGSAGRYLKEITSRGRAGCSPGHLVTLFAHDIIIQPY